MKMKKNFLSILNVGVFFNLTILIVWSSLLLAQEGDEKFFPYCREEQRAKLLSLFEDEIKEKVPLPPMTNNFEMLMAMEEIKNVPFFRQGTKIEVAQMGAYPRNKVEIQLAKDFPKEIRNFFIRRIKGKEKVFFPVHPHNQDPHVAGFEIVNNPLTPDEDIGTIELRNLASRSKVAVQPGLPFFGLKLATDYILPTIHQPGKTDLTGESFYSRARTQHIEETDKMIGLDPTLMIQREIGVFRLKDAEEERAFIIRDMDALQDGDIYIPALSLPYVGRQIARLNHENFEKFWGTHYAFRLGKAKAKLLLRYGLQMLTPNSQNILIRLDNDFKPQGIVFRDNTDAHFVRPVISALDPKSKWFKHEEEMGNFIKEYLFPYSSNSTWRFDEAPAPHKISAVTINLWNDLQAQGYAEEINQTLNLKLKPLSLLDPEIDDYKKLITDSHHHQGNGNKNELRYVVPIFNYLTSEEGKKKLADYRKKQIEAEAERKLKLAEEQQNAMWVEECLNPQEIVTRSKKRKTVTLDLETLQHEINNQNRYRQPQVHNQSYEPTSGTAGNF